MFDVFIKSDKHIARTDERGQVIVKIVLINIDFFFLTFGPLISLLSLKKCVLISKTRQYPMLKLSK